MDCTSRGRVQALTYTGQADPTSMQTSATKLRCHTHFRPMPLTASQQKLQKKNHVTKTCEPNASRQTTRENYSGMRLDQNDASSMHSVPDSTPRWWPNMSHMPCSRESQRSTQPALKIRHILACSWRRSRTSSDCRPPQQRLLSRSCRGSRGAVGIRSTPNRRGCGSSRTQHWL